MIILGPSYVPIKPLSQGAVSPELLIVIDCIMTIVLILIRVLGLWSGVLLLAVLVL